MQMRSELPFSNAFMSPNFWLLILRNMLNRGGRLAASLLFDLHYFSCVWREARMKECVPCQMLRSCRALARGSY